MMDPADSNPVIIQALAAFGVCVAIAYVIWFFIDYFKAEER